MKINLTAIDNASQAFRNLAKSIRKIPWYKRLWIYLWSWMDDIRGINES